MLAQIASLPSSVICSAHDGACRRCELVQRNHEIKTGKVRIGVIGAGVFGGYHAQKIAASKHAVLVGVVDKQFNTAQALVSKVGRGEVFASIEALFAAVDAVVIATPASTH